MGATWLPPLLTLALLLASHSRLPVAGAPGPVRGDGGDSTSPLQIQPLKEEPRQPQGQVKAKETESVPTPGVAPVPDAQVPAVPVEQGSEVYSSWKDATAASNTPSALPDTLQRMAGVPGAGFSRPNIFATGSACGYGNIFEDGFGVLRVAANDAIFGAGAMCGACFQVRCNAQRAPLICRKTATVTLTVTDKCVSNPMLGRRDLCTTSPRHLSLPRDIYASLALNWNKGGGKVLPHMPILFRRVACKRRGGLEFALNGSPNMLQVNVRNVGGAGTVDRLWVLPRRTRIWLPMQRIWGQNWIAPGSFVGQGLSFKVLTAVTNATVVAADVVPPGWGIGEVYRGMGQFL